MENKMEMKWKVYREKDKQISAEFFLFLFVWFDWALFVNGSIMIGWNKVIREYCIRPNRCVGKRVTYKICSLLRNMKHVYYKRTLQIKQKMSTYWPPRSSTVTGAISSSSLSEKSSPESVSYSTGGGRASATATATRQVSISFVISTNFRQNRGSGQTSRN